MESAIVPMQTIQVVAPTSRFASSALMQRLVTVNVCGAASGMQRQMLASVP